MLTRYVYGTKSNIPDYYVKHDTVYRVISDHLGNLRMVVNTATGEVTYRAEYNAFGAVTTNYGSTELPFGFAGGMYDSLTGLTRFGARDYSAREGRWTAKDPIQFNGGDYNLYGYCLTDPVNRVDVNGLSWEGRFQSSLIFLASRISTIRYTSTAAIIGKAGELAVNASKNTSMFVTRGKNLVPDIYDKSNKIIGEIKNVNYQAWTKQLQEYYALAKELGFDFYLYIEEHTRISSKVLQLADEGKIILKIYSIQ